MAAVKVFGPPMSTAVSRVLACLFEKEVDFQLINVDMSQGEKRDTNSSLQQPFGQVPAFQDGEITLFESRAICRYISGKYAERGNKRLMGMNLLERASIEQWLEAEGQSFHPPRTALVFQLAFAPQMNLKQNPALIAQSEEKLGKVLDIYEKRLEEGKYLAGDEFTLADLSHVPNSQYLVTVTDRGSLCTGKKNVNRWWEEISSRPSWKKVVEMQKPKSAKA